ncbi:hypothetical protein SPHS6_00378 [Sphingobium sp. S6]|nr:hypothetical protein SPHS8_00378 [Sphingobium sp. S8]CAD7335200.1 hypothetical protein SPHS6_00378 [Sphingobium sp. S6]CAD7335279.1 hypothetical protein SPHS8_00427 [Sphingobium sp. S8]
MSRAKIAPAAARSDAVRGCSLGALSPREDLGASTAAAASTATAAQQLATRAATGGRSAFAPRVRTIPGPFSRDQYVSRCTPARWVAGKLDCQWSSPFGSGVAVLARTNAEPRQNHQHIEIAAFSPLVLWFSGNARASRVRPRTHVGARVYARQKHRTTEPHLIIINNHGLSGSGLVLRWFSPEPARQADAQQAESGSIRNKIPGGYSSAAHVSRSDLLIRGQIDGRGAKTFGAAIAAGTLGRVGGGSIDLGGSVDSDQAQHVVGNGGFLRFSGCRSARVGTAMLEQAGEKRGNTWVFEPRRKLCRLTSGAASGADRLALGRPSASAAAGGVAPPCAARQIPSSLADAIFQISIDDRIACHAGPVNGRQVGGAVTGPGDRAFRALRHAAAGRGVNADWGLRRSGQPSGGSAHVN